MKKISQIIVELESNQCSNLELTKKVEFQKASKLVYETETALCTIVGSFDNEPWLLLLTDRRVTMVQKETEIGGFVYQYGLEQIKDLKLDSFGEIAALTFILENSHLIKIDYLKLNQANEFGRLLAKAVKIWTDNLEQFLL